MLCRVQAAWGGIAPSSSSSYLSPDCGRSRRAMSWFRKQEKFSNDFKSNGDRIGAYGRPFSRPRHRTTERGRPTSIRDQRSALYRWTIPPRSNAQFPARFRSYCFNQVEMFVAGSPARGPRRSIAHIPTSGKLRPRAGLRSFGKDPEPTRLLGRSVHRPASVSRFSFAVPSSTNARS